MTKPDFSSMSRKELRAYLLTHRHNREAFYAYIDRSEVEADWVEMPPIASSQDLEKFPEFFERLRQDQQQSG